jgi:hypothetical protein
MLLIYSEPGSWHALTAEQRDALYREYDELTDELRRRGRTYVASHELQPSKNGRSVEIRGGERIVTEGPFAETKEVVGGYYLIESGSLDEATEGAARIPSARLGASRGATRRRGGCRLRPAPFVVRMQATGRRAPCPSTWR